MRPTHLAARARGALQPRAAARAAAAAARVFSSTPTALKKRAEIDVDAPHSLLRVGDEVRVDARRSLLRGSLGRSGQRVDAASVWLWLPTGDFLMTSARGWCQVANGDECGVRRLGRAGRNSAVPWRWPATRSEEVQHRIHRHLLLTPPSTTRGVYVPQCARFVSRPAVPQFMHRHIGPRDSDIVSMLQVPRARRQRHHHPELAAAAECAHCRAASCLPFIPQTINPKYKTLEDLVAETVPASIRLGAAVTLPAAATESEALAELKEIAGKNKVVKNMIGMGYYETLTPGVILRNLLENPGASGLSPVVDVVSCLDAAARHSATGDETPRLPHATPVCPQAGTRRTRRTRRRSARAGSSRCSTSKRSSRT